MVSQTIRPVMLSARQVATMTSCSVRTVYRLRDAGQLPPPIAIGGMIRWRAAEIDQWLADGCPPWQAAPDPPLPSNKKTRPVIDPSPAGHDPKSRIPTATLRNGT